MGTLERQRDDTHARCAFFGILRIKYLLLKSLNVMHLQYTLSHKKVFVLAQSLQNELNASVEPENTHVYTSWNYRKNRPHPPTPHKFMRYSTSATSHVCTSFDIVSSSSSILPLVPHTHIHTHMGWGRGERSHPYTLPGGGGEAGNPGPITIAPGGGGPATPLSYIYIYVQVVYCLCSFPNTNNS